ncbi:MAG: DUF4190 domain-containing protein [Nitrospirae bacterium]|nr:DUF4190 domain-containing protein [Nitrospirota bacterium]
MTAIENSTQERQPLSKWCLWLGISSLFFGIITGLPAIVCGHISFARLKRLSNNTGKRLILVGLALGYLSTLFTIAYIFLFIYSGYKIT